MLHGTRQADEGAIMQHAKAFCFGLIGLPGDDLIFAHGFE